MLVRVTIEIPAASGACGPSLIRKGIFLQFEFVYHHLYTKRDHLFFYELKTLVALQIITQHVLSLKHIIQRVNILLSKTNTYKVRIFVQRVNHISKTYRSPP